MGDDLYQWGTLASKVGLDERAMLNDVGIISRGGVVKEFRRAGVMSGMLTELEQSARAASLVILVGAVEVENERAKRWFESNGFRLYCISRSVGRFQGDFYFKDLRVSRPEDEGRTEPGTAPDRCGR